MQIEIVKKTGKDINNRKDNTNYIFFYGNKINKIEKPKNGLQYKEGDVVFIEKNNKGISKIKEYHTYKALMNYLDKNNNMNLINKSLLINKFTNIFNLEKKYSINDDEKRILENIKAYSNIIKQNLGTVYSWLIIDGKLNDKLVIGLGNQSVFETDITLHNTYGIPYIPGSALKGVLRNYIIQEYFKECEEKANTDKLFLTIFGGKNENKKSVQGKVIFMDAFPNRYFNIIKDFMTTHHADYYSKENKIPLDTDEPNPLPFLVLQNDNKNSKIIEFKFDLGVNKEILNIKINNDITKTDKILNKYENKTVKEFLLDNIIDTLEYNGIGAKTSVGYGYFNINKEKCFKKNYINYTSS